MAPKHAHDRKPTGATVLREDVTEAIVHAVLDELAESEYGRTAMGWRRAPVGFGKSALYRRWPGKLEMRLDIVSALSVGTAQPSDEGSLREDLRAMLEAIVSWLDDSRIGRIVSTRT
jgi:hypothetical protein